MTRRSVLWIAFHGTLLVTLGMCVGLPFAQAIVSNAGPDAERAWRVAHTSLVSGGTLYLAVAAVAHHLVLPAAAARFVSGSLVFSAYAFAFAFVVGPLIGARGLEPTGPPLHLLVFALSLVSLLLVFVSAFILLWGFRAALRGSPPE